MGASRTDAEEMLCFLRWVDYDCDGLISEADFVRARATHDARTPGRPVLTRQCTTQLTASCVRQVHVVLHGRAKPKEGIAERSNKWQKAAVALESKGVLSPSPAKTSRGNLRRFLGRRGEPKDE